MTKFYNLLLLSSETYIYPLVLCWQIRDYDLHHPSLEKLPTADQKQVMVAVKLKLQVERPQSEPGTSSNFAIMSSHAKLQ